MKYGGWYQVAFAHQLKSDLSSLELGDRRLLVARTGDDYEIFDAACPHRGMDLGFGKMVGDRVVQCPYHGHRISLGGEGGGPFCVRQYRSLLFQGLILALVGDFNEGPLPATLAGIGRTHKIFHGFETAIRAPLDVVMDNTFDWAHFTNVHHLLGMKHSETIVEDGVLSATSMLKLRASIWQAAPGGADTFEMPLLSRAYGPGFAVVQIAATGGDHPHYVIASGVPQRDGTSILRLSVALPFGADGSEPLQQVADVMVEYEKRGLEQDRRMWENLDRRISEHLTSEDRGINAFRDFCERFRLPE